MRVEQVFMTPLAGESVYGDEVDVSDYVRVDGLSKIKRSIDSTDYSIGVYRLDDLKLKCQNALGTFSENDSRSIFPFVRDKAKVRVAALKINPETYVTETKVQFEGLINDEATRQNITSDIISLTVISKDSVFRTSRVPAGIITTGLSVKNAIFTILSQPEITALLTVDIANINPGLDFPIDTPGELDNLEVREALDLLIRAANSVLILKNDTVFVQEREDPTKTEEDALVLRGRGEITNNANIIAISGYNNGKQRQFNSILLNDGAVVVEDASSILEFGFRQIKFDFPMVNDLGTLRDIGRNIADEFRYPKIELKVTIPTVVAEDFDLLDLVKIDAPWLKKPLPGNFFPIYGVAKYGDLTTPYPEIQGSVQIYNNLKFKIIEIENNLKTFTTSLKCRQYGKFTNDGVFVFMPPAIYGQAIYGKSEYGVV